MPNQIKIIDEDTFFDQYKPLRNPAADESEAFEGTLFEEYEDTHVVRTTKRPDYTLWTLVEDETWQPIPAGQEEYASQKRNRVILNGMNVVNRLGYFITGVPYNEGEKITVSLEENNE